MKIGAIIQARTSSSRLPGKVLKELPYNSGITVIEQVYKRVSVTTKIDQVILATSKDKSDKALVKLANKKGMNVFEGSLNNVLERYYLAAVEHDFDLIVRITGDCPCIDPELIDQIIDQHIKNKADFTNISLKRTFPHGLDTAVFSFNALKEAYENAKHDFEKQHVTTYFYQTKPENYKIHIVEAEKEFNRPDIRITLDTMEDYALICCVYDALYDDKQQFRIKDIITLFNQKPWLLNINAKVKQKEAHKDVQSEIEEVIKYCYRQDLHRVKKILAEYKH